MIGDRQEVGLVLVQNPLNLGTFLKILSLKVARDFFLQKTTMKVKKQLLSVRFSLTL